jgi:hypothetical protein
LTFREKSAYNARQNSQEILYEYLEFCNQCHRQSKKANIKGSWVQKGIDSAGVKITNNPMDIPYFTTFEVALNDFEKKRLELLALTRKGSVWVPLAFI